MTAEWTPAAAPPIVRADFAVAAVLFVLGWVIAASYLPSFRSAGGVQQFYQQEYGPAVMLACGRGLVNPDVRVAPELAAFLDGRRASFDCRTLPASVAAVPFNVLQGVTRYLLTAAALVWRIRGVAWPALDSLLAGMFAVAVTGAYVALRFVSGRFLSIAGTLFWAASPMHLQNLPHARDYSKAPYLVLTVVAMAAVIAERNTKRLAAIGALFGLVQGVGLGMRSDVLLNFVPFLAALMFAGSRRVSEQVTGKLVCAAAAIAVFVVVSLPVLRTYSDSEGFWHVSLLGLTTPFDDALHVRAAPYDFGYVYSDSYMEWVVETQWSRRHGGSPGADPASAPAGAASREYYTTLAASFPGDFATRMLGSVLSVLNLPFSISYGFAPIGVSAPLLVTLETWRARLLLFFAGAGPLAAIVLLVGIGLTRLRDAWVSFGLLLFWAAYPFLQFHGRHVFHLEFLVIAMFVWLISLGWRTFRSARAHAPAIRLVWRSAALAVALCVAVAGAVFVARAVQAPRVRALLSGYQKAPTEPVAVTRQELGDGQVRLVTRAFERDGAAPRIRHEMVVVSMASASCAASPLRVTFRYRRDGVPADLDFSRTVTMPGAEPDGASGRVFFPAYAAGSRDSTGAGFVGVDLPEGAADCVRIARVRDTSALPLLLDATLAPGWEERPLHARVRLDPLVPERVWVRVARWWPALAALG